MILLVGIIIGSTLAVDALSLLCYIVEDHSSLACLLWEVAGKFGVLLYP